MNKSGATGSALPKPRERQGPGDGFQSRDDRQHTGFLANDREEIRFRGPSLKFNSFKERSPTPGFGESLRLRASAPAALGKASSAEEFAPPGLPPGSGRVGRARLVWEHQATSALRSSGEGLGGQTPGVGSARRTVRHQPEQDQSGAKII